MMPIAEQISHAAALIRRGGVVAFPTETVYGLGANALDPRAVAKIFEIKERPFFDPLIVHIADRDQLSELTPVHDPRVFRLIDAFWPGPLTLVLVRNSKVPDIVTAGLPTVAIRNPNHPVALQLIREAGVPIAAPSANKFGRVSPTRARHVAKLHGVDMILDGGDCSAGVESTIIALNPNGFTLLRPGCITKEELEQYLPWSPDANLDVLSNARAPGMMKSHYSPAKALYFIGSEPEGLHPSKGGILVIGPPVPENFRKVIVLSNTFDLREYAAGLFAALHEMEESDVEYILVPPVEEKGLGLAIMDRLRKASWRYNNERNFFNKF